MSKKIFITGVSGLLGLNVALYLKERYELSGCYYAHPVALDGVRTLKLDLTSYDATYGTLRQIRPDVVIHTAALTNVDACETDPDLAYRLNVGATLNIAKAANTLDAQLIHVSTDQLFDGLGPWKKEDDPPSPLNVYGRTKLQAEEDLLKLCPDALVIRTNFYGWGTSLRRSFSDWILTALQESGEITMFTDVFFTPVLTDDLIDLVIELHNSGATGIFNVAGRKRLSKLDFAFRLARLFDYPTDKISATSVEGFPFKAQRPKDMSLSSSKAELQLGTRMPSLNDGLTRLKNLETEGRRTDLNKSIVSELAQLKSST